MNNIITDLKILRADNSSVSIEESKDIIKKLEISLQNSITGVGLAASQVGINKRVAIIRINNEIIDLVNPTVIEKENMFINFNEKCLSLPNVCINTKRYREIYIKDDLHPDGVIAVGDVATVILHEVDHLDGILMIDRMMGSGKIGRNDPCPCGKRINNKPVKRKKCHGRE